MREPHWAHVKFPPIDYQGISYYSAPKPTGGGPKSLAEVDPKLLDTYEKLGVPLHERTRLAGVAVDAVFDSVSVATTFKGKLGEAGVIFCSISEAVQTHPELVEQYLGTWCRTRQLFRGAEFGGVLPMAPSLRAEGRALPDGAVHLLPHQRCKTGQFERTLIIADEGSRKLSRRLHGAHARRKPAARRGRRTRRPRRCLNQVLDGAELVSRR